MAVNGNGQFQYPASDWAEGTMRTAAMGRGSMVPDASGIWKNLMDKAKSRGKQQLLSKDDARNQIRTALQNGDQVTLGPEHYDIFHDEYTKFKGANGANSSK